METTISPKDMTRCQLLSRTTAAGGCLCGGGGLCGRTRRGSSIS